MAINKNGYWISPKNQAYFCGHLILKVDLATFQILNETWAKDAKCVYSYGQRTMKADVNSFLVLNRLYAKDKNLCYYMGGIIKEADAASFQVLDEGCFTRIYHNGLGEQVRNFPDHSGYAADDANVFYYQETFGKPCKIRKVDRGSFQVLGFGYGRDKNNVICGIHPLKGADVSTFEVIPPIWGKDKNQVYYGGELLKKAIAMEFRLLSSAELLTTDGTRFYKSSREIPREEAYPFGCDVPGFPLSFAHDLEKATDYLMRGATPHDHSALSRAAGQGNVELIKLIIGAGCDPKKIEKENNSLLTNLHYEKYLEIAKLLVEAGANPNHVVPYTFDEHGYAMGSSPNLLPLQYALDKKWFDLAEYLITVGANVDANTAGGPRLIEFYRRRGNAEVVEYLRSKGA